MLKRLWNRLSPWARIRRMNEEWARGVVEEFARKFPGRCMICSMHRFGRNSGYEQRSEPEPHECIERIPDDARA
jgi:hypothetical protein